MDGTWAILGSKLGSALALDAAVLLGDALATGLVGALVGAAFTPPPPQEGEVPRSGGGGAPSLLAGLVAGLLLRGTVLAFTDDPRGAVGPAPVAVAPAAGPNILLLTLDTTRADRGDPSGDRGFSTPTLDAIAREGARFDRAYSQIPVTGPSHLTILSGRGPWEHGNLLNGLAVPAALPLLPETLASSGYATAAFVSGYVLEGALGFARGFGVYDDDFAGTGAWRKTAPGALVAMARRRLAPDDVLERRGDRTVDAALAWLGRPRDRPFFLWVHLFDPHGPYAPPPPWDTRYYGGDPRDPGHRSMAQVTGVAPYLRASLAGITDADWVVAQYGGEVSFADQQAGRLVDAVGRDALVVYAADHGESLGEHGVWFNHGDDVYAESTRVPLAIRSPDVRAGTIATAPVELADLAATILDLVAIPSPLGGESLVSLLAGGGPPRPYARSLCFDRAANARARAAGTIDRPTYRMVALAGVDGTLFHRDAPGSADEWSGAGAPPVDEAAALLGEVPGSDRDRATLERLGALGYTE